MRYCYIRFVIVVLCFVFFYRFTYAASLENRESILNLTQKTISLAENQEKNRDEIEKNISEIKQLVQSELKSGKKNASIDIYLFLMGVVKNDLLSLQSLLVSSQKQDFSKNLASLISESSARKLAFAIKENRIAHKVTISIKNNSGKKQCDLYVNGTYFPRVEFISTAGVPLYVGLYCADNSFAVQYVQSEEVQNYLQVDLVPGSALSPRDLRPSAAGSSYFSSFTLRTGINLTQGFGEYAAQYLSNFNMQDGAFIASTSFLSYQNFIVTFDITRLSYIDIAKNKIQSALYFKPGIGYMAGLLSMSKYIKLKNDVQFNIVTLTNGPQKNIGFGLQYSIGPDFKLGKSELLADFRLFAGYSTGPLNGVQIGFLARMGYEF